MSFRVGKIFGITLRIHFSLIFIFFLITWSLAMGYMPQQFPGLSQWSYWFIGAMSGVILMTSVVVHELCHSVVARKLGLPVRRITLFFLGGASELPEEPKTPGVELRMALAGPLSSFVLASLLGALWYFFRGGFPTELIALTQYGAGINLILGVFNLLPAFPMDGGRVFRAVLWRLKGSLIKATRAASMVGVGLSYLMMFGGFLIMIFGGFFNGLWIVFIGWFIKSGAESGLSQTIISQVLSKTSVREIMSKDVVTVDYDLPLERLVKDYFLIQRFGAYPAMKGGGVVGIVTIGDVKRVPRSGWKKTTVKDVMKPIDDLTVEPETAASDVMYKMSRQGVGRILVMENDQLRGIVSRSDLTHIIKARTSLEEI